MLYWLKLPPTAPYPNSIQKPTSISSNFPNVPPLTSPTEAIHLLSQSLRATRSLFHHSPASSMFIHYATKVLIFFYYTTAVSRTVQTHACVLLLSRPGACSSVVLVRPLLSSTQSPCSVPQNHPHSPS